MFSAFAESERKEKRAKRQVLEENIMVWMVWRSYESENLRKVDLNREYGRKDEGVDFAEIITTEGQSRFQTCRNVESVLWIATKLRRMLL